MRNVIFTTLLMFATLMARAETYTIYSDASSGNGSLRWAIEQANQTPGPDIVEIPAQYDSNRPLIPGLAPAEGATTPLIITDDITIIGMGNERAVIDDKQRWVTAAGLINVGHPFDTGSTILRASGTLFRINPNDTAGRTIDVIIENIAVTHTGTIVDSDNANVTFKNVALHNNVSQKSNDNLILHGSGGRLTLQDSIIYENSVDNGEDVILVVNSDIYILNSALADNGTGSQGISSSRLLLHVSTSQHEAVIRDSYFAGFSSGSVEFNKANVEISNSLFDARSGLPTRSIKVTDGDLTLTNSTLFFNPQTTGSFPALFEATHIELSGTAQLISNNSLILSTDAASNTLPMIYPVNWDDTSIHARAVNKNNYISAVGVDDSALNMNPLACWDRSKCFVPNELTLPLIDSGNDAAALYADGSAITKDYLMEVRPQGDAIEIGAYEKHDDQAYPHNDSYETQIGVAILKDASEGILANDTKPDGLDAVVSREPLHGTLTLNTDGSFLYASNEEYYGQDSFVYDLGGKLATVSIEVQSAGWIQIPDNQQPITVADSYTLHTTEVITIDAPGVLENDRDDQNTSAPFYQDLTARLHSAPSNGTVTFNADGSFIYTPSTGFVGTDEFYYDATDIAQKHSLPQKVSILVKAGDPPTTTDTGTLGKATAGGSIGFSAIFLLLLLAAIRVKNIKVGITVVGLVFSIFSTTAVAEKSELTDTGFIANVDLGMSYLSPDLDGTEWQQDAKTQPAFGVGIGYQFDSNWSAHLRYNWLNEAELESNNVAYPDTKINYQLFSISAKYRINQLWGDQFAPFAILGVSYFDIDVSGAQELIDVDKNTHLNYGVGVNLNNNSYGKIDLVWESISEDVQIVSVQFILDIPM